MPPSSAQSVFIRTLHIDGFGQFHDLELGFSPGLNVVHGQNEAGKSTIFAFIRAVLFGFSSRKGGHNRYQPKSAGVMGGRVVLATPEGDLSVSRVVKKRVDGELLVRDGRGEEVPPSRLVEALAGMSRELFEAVFSLTLDDLRDFERLSKEDTISNALFVSGVPGARRVPAAVEALKNEADELFRPKGATKHFNVAFERLKEVRAKVLAKADRPQEYAAARAASELLEQRMPVLEGNRKTAYAQLRTLEALAKLKPELERGLKAELALKDLGPTTAFDALALERLERALDEEQKTKHERDLREREASQTVAARTQLQAGLWGQEPAQVLAEALEAAMRLQALGDALSGRRAVLDEEQQKWRTEAAELGLDISAVNATAVVRARLVDLKERRERAESQRARAEDAHQAAKADRDRAGSELAALEESLAQTPEIDLDVVENALAALHSLEAVEQQWADLRRRRDALSEESAPPVASSTVLRPPSWGWAAVVLLLLAPLVAALAAPSWLPVIAAAALPLAAFCAWVLFRAAQASSPLPHVSGGRERLAEIESQLAALQARQTQFRTAGGVNADEPCAAARARWVTRRQQGQARAQVQRELVIVRQRLGVLEERCRNAAGEGEAFNGELVIASAALEAALLQAGLPKTLSSGSAVELFDRCAALAKRAAATRDEEARFNADATRWAKTLESLREAGRGVGLELPAAEQRALEMARSKMAEHQKKLTEVGRLSERLSGLEEARATAATRFDEAATALSKMLAERGCENVEAFRVDAAKAERAAALKVELNAVAANTQLTLGCSIDAARQQLAAAEPFDDTLANARDAVKQLEDELGAAQRERGELKHKLQTWEDDTELQALRYEEGQLRGELLDTARRVTTARMAAKLLSRAKEDFERHHQPRLLTRASELFTQLTRGRYTRLFMAGGEAANLSATDHHGEVWLAHELSRGTQDQLFLAFRVAVAEEVGARRFRLPVMVDDVMVNFDEPRGQAAVQMLAQLAKSHQTVVFSCQANTRAWLEAAGAHSVAINTAKQLRLIEVDANG